MPPDWDREPGAALIPNHGALTQPETIAHIPRRKPSFILAEAVGDQRLDGL